MKPKPNQTELLVVVSDLHCGSNVGLAAPETRLDSGNIVTHGNNLCQAWLWFKWVEMCNRVAKIIGTSKAALLVNGDATEGIHHRNEKDNIANEIMTHVEMANQCLEPLLRVCKTRFVVKGTECHTKDMESKLADMIKAEEGIAKDKWHFKIKGCEIDAAHHMPTTSRAYLEASALSICMGNARQNYQRAGHSVPKVFLRGHRHCGGFYSDGDGLYAVTSAWQFLTRHGHKVVTDSIPRPSVMVLDWRACNEGDIPAVHYLNFNPPPHEAEDY